MESETLINEPKNLKDKPIMQLFCRLIHNESKQNTVLTDNQITNILEQEFLYETTTLHELELDIYVYVIKKFLKDWPQWDKLDQTVNKLKTQNNYEAIQQILIVNYNSLKNYLENMLKAVKPYIKEQISKADKSLSVTNEKDSQVVLEIKCSRSQLNQLILSQPQSIQNTSFKTVFNVIEDLPSKISFSRSPLESILNSTNFCIHINLKGLIIMREVKHELEHVLVNKADKKFYEENPKPLNQSLQTKPDSKTKTIHRDDLKKIFDHYGSLLNKKPQEAVMEVIMKDLSYLPDSFQVPGSFRKFMSRYSYVRYLYSRPKKIKENSMYDLQMEETLSPRFQFFLKVDPTLLFTGLQQSDVRKVELTVECKTCEKFFNGDEVLHKVTQHYMDYHQMEDDSGPDWMCSKCRKQFKTQELTYVGWYHDC